MSIIATMRSRWWVKRFSALVFFTTLLAATLAVAIDNFHPYYRLAINGSASLPGWIYLVTVGDKFGLQRGEVIAFHPPHNDHFPNGVTFMKKVMGLPGDVVSETERSFSINGQYVGFAKTHAQTGELLDVGPVGVIPEGAYFVWTPHEDSYDSRYKDIGWIGEDRIIGRAVRLL